METVNSGLSYSTDDNKSLATITRLVRQVFDKLDSDHINRKSPMDGVTPLSQQIALLVSGYARTVAGHYNTDPKDIVATPNTLLGDIVSTWGTPERYDELMSNTSTFIATAYNEHINFARNVANPLVMETVEKVGSYQPAKIALDVEHCIVQVEIPPLLLLDDVALSVKKTIEDYGGQTPGYQMPNTPKTLPIGNDDYVRLITDVVGSKMPEIYAYLGIGTEWFDGFLNNLNTRSDLMAVTQQYLGAYLPKALFALDLLYRGLALDPTHYPTGTPTNGLAASIQLTIRELDKQLYKELAVLDKMADTKVLYLGSDGYSTSDVTYLVLGSVYRDYIKQGGNVEAVLGAFVSGDSYVSLDTIVNLQQNYIATWHKTQAVRAEMVKVSTLDAFKEAVRLAYLGLDWSTVIVDKAYTDKDVTYAKRTNDEALAYIRTLTTKDIDNVVGVARTLVCGIRLGYTNAYEILEEIDRIDNPDIPPRDAAAIACVYVLTNYWLKQTNLPMVGS